MSDVTRRPTFGSSLTYRDPAKALEWLEQAFGFETTMVITDDDGLIVHAEMAYGDGYIMVGAAWAAWTKSPKDTGGANTQALHVRLDDGIEEHCERALAAGAVIMEMPEDQFWGARRYRAIDPGGHVWTFEQEVRAVSREEAEAATGLRIKGWA